MRLAARKTATAIRARHERLTSEHLRADPLRKLFPDIEQLRIEFLFDGSETHLPPPSPQLRTLFPAAPAFFRFACPCADCDGEFDLTDAAATLMTNSAGRKRAASFTGQLSCRGVRFRDHALHQSSCSMQLSFKLRAEPRRTE
jgi:hypothetical protein